MADLFAQFAGWLHDVFVKQIDFWVILGFVAQFFFNDLVAQLDAFVTNIDAGSCNQFFHLFLHFPAKRAF